MTSPSTPTPAAQADAGVVENMLKVRAASSAGLSYADLLAEEVPASTGTALPPPTATEISYVISGSDALIAVRPAELAPVAPPPGLTVRGWSAEVTARHPVLVADAMAELASAGAGAAPSDAIDPTDPAALVAAQRELGFADVRKNNLKVAAIQLQNDRLSEAIGAAVNGSAAAQAAYAEAVEDAQAAAEGASGGGSTQATAPAAPKTTTTRTSTSSSSTPSTSS
jgi:hypothetical protein